MGSCQWSNGKLKCPFPEILCIAQSWFPRTDIFFLQTKIFPPNIKKKKKNFHLLILLIKIIKSYLYLPCCLWLIYLNARVFCPFSILPDLLEMILHSPGFPFPIHWILPNEYSSFNWNSLWQKLISNLSSERFCLTHFHFFVSTRGLIPCMCCGAPSQRICVFNIFIFHSENAF